MICLLLLICLGALSDDARGQNVQQINVLFTNDVDNNIARNAVVTVLAYIQRNPSLNLDVSITTVESYRTDSNTFLDSICARYGEAITNNQAPHLVFDTTMSSLSSETVKSITSTLALPTISASFGQNGDLRQWRDITLQKESYLLQIMPPADIIPMVVRSIIEYMNISDAAILHDESFVMDHKYKALLKNVPARHVITPIAPSAERVEQIEQLFNLDINNFFILGSIGSIKGVLDAAKDEYFKRTFAWHAITQDSDDVSCSCKNTTVMFLKPSRNPEHLDRLKLLRETYNLTMEPEVTSMFYFDLALKSFLAIRDLMQNGDWPSDLQYITCEEFDGTNSPNRTIDLKTSLMAVTEPTAYGDFVWPSTEPFNGYSYMNFDMEITANVLEKGVMFVSKSLGTWTAGLNSSMNIVDQETMETLAAAIIYRVYTIVQPPFVMLDPTAPKGFKGYCIDLLDEIAKILHFDYTIQVEESGLFGNVNDQGEWNGVIRKLIDKQADIALGTVSVIAERETVIDFTVPIYDLVGSAILMLLPSEPSSLFKFLTVLETNVWLCILAAYLFTTFLMWAFDRWSPYSYQNNRELYNDDIEKRVFNIKECLWFCVTSLTPQGGGEAPKNISGRLVAATWWLFGFIIIASYTANLAAFLTVSRLDDPVDSLEGLSNQYKILYAPLNGSATMTYFQRMAAIESRFHTIWKDITLNESLSPVERSKLAVWDYPISDKYTKLWKAIQEAGLPNTLEEGLERVRNSTSIMGFALLDFATVIRYLVMTNCDLQMVGEEFSRKPYAIGVQQGSALKDQFNNAILMLLNKRTLEKLKEDWWSYEHQSNCENPDEMSDGISIENVGGVFIVIFVCIGIACITLVVEYWYYRYRQNPQIVHVAEANTQHQQRMNTMNKLAVVADGNSHPPKKYQSKLAKEIQRMKNNELRARITIPLPKPNLKFQI